MTIKKILVPTDFSAGSEVAVDDAMDLAAKLGAEVTLLHTYWLPIYPTPDGAAILPSPETVNATVRNADEALERLRKRISRPDVPVAIRTEPSPAAETIARIAAEQQFDLIVMGTHGRTGLKHLLIGSIAERVVRISTVPVLTVHPLASAKQSPVATPPLL